MTHDPLDPDEVVYRRLSTTANPSRFDRITKAAVANAADFYPHKENDPDGLSFFRENYRPSELCALTPRKPTQANYLGKFRVRDLRAAGLTIEPEPDELDKRLGGVPAHACVRNLNSQTDRDSTFLQEKTIWLAEICEVVGPFDPPAFIPPELLPPSREQR